MSLPTRMYEVLEGCQGVKGVEVLEAPFYVYRKPVESDGG